MDILSDMLKSPIGILSLFTIGMVCVIATFMFFWVKKQADKDGRRNR